MPYFVSGMVLDAAGDPISGAKVRAYRRSTGALLGEAVTFDGTVAPADPHAASVVCLIRADEGVIADESSSPKTLTTEYPMPVVTTPTAFGTAGSITGNAGGIVSPSNPAFEFAGDFTFEAEVYISNWGVALQGLFDVGGYSPGVLFRIRSDVIECFRAGGATNLYWPGGILPVNTFNHIAVARQGGNTRVFLNGVLAGTATNVTGTIAAAPFRFGAAAHAPGSEYIRGFLDEIRITNGVARYTANFARPISPHPGLVAGAPEDYLPGKYKLRVGTADPGEVDVVFLDPDGGTFQNDVIHRAIPYAQ